MTDETAVERMLREGRGLSDAQLNAAIFMGFDHIWAELRRLEAAGRVERGSDGLWRLVR